MPKRAQHPIETSDCAVKERRPVVDVDSGPNDFDFSSDTAYSRSPAASSAGLSRGGDGPGLAGDALRPPSGLIGDGEHELTPDRLEMLLGWHGGRIGLRSRLDVAGAATAARACSSSMGAGREARLPARSGSPG